MSHTTARTTRILSSLVLCGFSASAFAQEDAELQEGAEAGYSGPPIVERMLSGVHVCTGLTDGEPCGEDRWTMTVQSDGTRTLRSFLNDSGGGTQINMVMHSDAKTFRPISAFADVYFAGSFLGAGHFAVDGDVLRVSVNSPTEHFNETIDLPDTFTLLLHPISADGWHYGAGYDMIKGGEQMHSLCTMGAARRSVLCAINPIALEFLGMETLTVPAGTFDTEHYNFGENTEVWVTGPDRVMIQHEYTVIGSRYQLVEFDGDL
ncbi:MAG: hypothetical protein P8L79_08920 [Rhodospirillaceae bacterium]|jgi:hypothetical protein|nr:hypothetical protein [Rhodospirillaceae bacterium]